MSRVLIGTSGYVYGHWRGRFYPRELPLREWLPFYAAQFPTVELNSPFYRLPRAATFRAWARAVPPGFVFAVKASRFLTHVKRLREPGPPLTLFLRRARGLGAARGPILFQLPARFHLGLDRLDAFLAALARRRVRRAVLEVRQRVLARGRRLRAAGACERGAVPPRLEGAAGDRPDHGRLRLRPAPRHPPPVRRLVHRAHAGR
jgi:uncharacterized protein YecE (DUF72 family)